MNAAAPSPLGTGLYPLREAAWLARLDTRTASRWARGYTHKVRGEPRASPGVMRLEREPLGTEPDLTFAEMLTLRLVRAFKGTGLHLRTIKRVAEKAAAKLELRNPFVSRRFRTDGRKIFMELTQPSARGEDQGLPLKERQLIEVLTGQQQFADVVEPSFQDIEWQDDLATRWWPLGRDHLIVLDPTVIFGAPHVAGTRIPAEQIAAAVRAEGGEATGTAAAAEWFGLTAAAVQDALRFESEWPRRVT